MFKTFVITLISVTYLYSNSLYIHFFDVGEGESAYIQTPSNEKILVDCGNPVNVDTIIDFFSKHNIKTLDALILTHHHLDHIGGVFQLLDSIQVKKRYDNGYNVNTKDDIYRWFKKFYYNENYTALKAQNKLHFGDTIIEIISPKILNGNMNESSLVLKVTYKNTAILLMADATIPIEKMLIKENVTLKADLLKIGHHGYKDATSKSFLEKVSPTYAIISINKNNIRNYPSDEVIKRLKEQNIQIFQTYKDGSVTFKSDGQMIKTSNFEK